MYLCCLKHSLYLHFQDQKPMHENIFCTNFLHKLLVTAQYIEQEIQGLIF